MFYRKKDLVVSATRYPKSISHVAENIAVVTAKEIEAMNAHTVSEVLNRISGLYINFNQDFGTTSLLKIQGSEGWHVLVLMDGVSWNFLASGAAETHSIPVGIIERIEIIKGPASSAWGSSLGGVVNIITKQPEHTDKPTGSLRASYGERNTQDSRAEVSGKIGPMGYYLFGGYQDSNGLRSSRYFERSSLYSKFTLPVSDNADVGFTMGYSEPHTKLGDFPSQDITSTGDDRTFFMTGSLNSTITEKLGLSVSFHHFKQKSTIENKALGLGFTGNEGERYLDTIYDEATTGASAKLVWDTGPHTILLGTDYDRGNLDQTLYAGSLLQSLGVPETSCAHPEMETWAVFANDTILIDRWSVTPGIRYDNNSITGAFISPSLGITYQADEDIIFRLSVARGFTLPPLSWTSGGALFLEPNPALEPEEVWSYQAGIESAATRYFWLKAAIFYHDLKNNLSRELYGAGSPTFNDLFVNKGKISRQGFELEAETIPFYNLTLLGGAAYVRIQPSEEPDTTNYTYNFGVRYDNRKSLSAQLCGHFIWWDIDDVFQASYDDFIWTFDLNKKVYSRDRACAEIFLTVHNLLNGNQYTWVDNKNPRRWVEAGIRMKF